MRLMTDVPTCTMNPIFFFFNASACCSVVARAAALGLHYPGVYAPAPPGTRPSRRLLGPQPYQDGRPLWKETGPDAASHANRQPDVRSPDGRPREPTHPWSWRGASRPAQRDHAAGRALPRGRSVIYRQPYSEEVKRVVPPTAAGAPGRPDLVDWRPQGRSRPPSPVYDGRDHAVDESVPNGRDVSVRGLPLPRSGGRGAYPSSIPGRGLARDAPVLRSSGSAARAPSGPDPGPAGIGLSGSLARPLRRRLHVEQPFAR